MYNGGGVGIADFNNDGLQDILFTGNKVANKLYLNRGDFKFDDITDQTILGLENVWSAGITIVDINNDDLPDIYINATFEKDSLARENKLFVNQGNKDGIPQFKEEAKQYGINDMGHSTQSVFFDYDLDGDLDLYVLTNVMILNRTNRLQRKIVDGSSPTNDRLYQNNGDGTFSNVSSKAGINIEGFGLGIAVSDINKDGYPDLYISNDFVMNDVLYMNNGDGTFTNKIKDCLKHQSWSSMGNDIADINDDGNIDIMTLDMLPADNKRVKQMFASSNYHFKELVKRKKYENQFTRNCLQINNGNGTFSDVSQMLGMDGTDWSWSALFADYNNDGHKDVTITNGFPRDITDHDFSDFRSGVQSMVYTDSQLLSFIPIVKIQNYIFQNKGDLQFQDVSMDWGFESNSFSNGAAFADLDNDGDLDYVVNNINDPAFLYKNNSDRLFPENNYLIVDLKGSKNNRNAFGAKITLSYGDTKKYYEYSPFRGYLSSVQSFAHFGLDSIQTIDQVEVNWLDGSSTILKNIDVNQTLKIDYLENQKEASNPINAAAKIFEKVETDFTSSYAHQEKTFQDFRIQALLPHTHSQEGPGIAVGDINGDQLEDIFIGNGAGHPGTFYVQTTNGDFEQKLLADTSKSEDLGAMLFDFENDGDNDLFIVSGSSEFLANSFQYHDRLFLNDGKGNFTARHELIKANPIAGSSVCAADFQGDGKMDLFVGGRLKPQSYPLSDESHLLTKFDKKILQHNDKFGLEIGANQMVTTALFTDFNNDDKVDLIIAGEWMPIRCFKNDNGHFVETSMDWGLDKTNGWWNSINGADFDKDGDIDYILGNQGLNNKYKASIEKPLLIYAKDFDQNKSVDNVMSAYINDTYYPIHLKNDLIRQLNYMRKKFPKFADYGAAKTEDLFSEEDLKDAFIGKTYTLESIYLENKGDHFEIHTLPRLAQVAPINGTLIDDYTKDGNLDVLLVGNHYGTEVFSGNHDAFVGLLLAGNGKGDFESLMINKSGFFVDGDAKALVKLYRNDGTKLIVASQNQDQLKSFSIENTQRIIHPKPMEWKAIIEYLDGTKEVKELYYGSAYLSASSRSFDIDDQNVKQITLIDFQGNKRTVK